MFGNVFPVVCIEMTHGNGRQFKGNWQLTLLNEDHKTTIKRYKRIMGWLFHCNGVWTSTGLGVDFVLPRNLSRASVYINERRLQVGLQLKHLNLVNCHHGYSESAWGHGVTP